MPCLIAGEWVVPAGGLRVPVENPADGTQLAELAYGGAEDARAAADAAADAFAGWAGRPARERADILRLAADLVDERRRSIGEMLSADTGKRRSEGEAEVHFSAEFLRWFAEAVRQPAGSTPRAEQKGRHQVTFTRAAGVAVCLTP